MQRLCSQAGPDPRGNGGSGRTRSSLLFWAQDFCAGRKWRLLTLPIKWKSLYPSWILLKMDVFIRDVVKSKLGYIMKEEQVVAVKAILEGKGYFCGASYRLWEVPYIYTYIWIKPESNKEDRASFMLLQALSSSFLSLCRTEKQCLHSLQ